MAVSYIVSEIKQDTGRKSRFLHTPFYITIPRGNGCEHFCVVFFHSRPDPWPAKSMRKLIVQKSSEFSSNALQIVIITDLYSAFRSEDTEALKIDRWTDEKSISIVKRVHDVTLAENACYWKWHSRVVSWIPVAPPMKQIRNDNALAFLSRDARPVFLFGVLVSFCGHRRAKVMRGL